MRKQTTDPRRVIAILSITSLTFTQCAVNDPAPGNPPHYQYTSADSVEATNMALWFTGELTAPAENMGTHLFNVKQIRSHFQDSLRLDSSMNFILSAKFIPPWGVGELSVKFTDTAAAQIRNGTYAGWDSLPPGMQPDSVRPPDFQNWSFIRYDAPMNPRRLADLYRGLPGVVIAEPNYHMYIDNYMNVYPTFVGGDYGYFFFFSGLGQGTGGYFKSIGGAPTFIGGLTFPSDSTPPWYAEVVNVADHFEAWDGYHLAGR